MKLDPAGFDCLRILRFPKLDEFSKKVLGLLANITCLLGSFDDKVLILDDKVEMTKGPSKGECLRTNPASNVHDH